MKYEKPALTLEGQADRLLERGLVADRDTLIKRLSMVSYYRLSGYLYSVREVGSDNYQPGTSLETVWNRYCFDRRLRMLFLDAIERIEVAIRTQLIYHFSHQYGAFGHCDEDNLPQLKITKYIEWRESIQVETSRSKEPFSKHFFEKYGDEHRNLPIWMVAELMSMGSMLTFYKGISRELQGKVSAHFDIPDKTLESWILSLYAARNICAHHSRLWNRQLGYAPGRPQKNKFPEWHQKNDQDKYELINNRSGMLLFICRHFLQKITHTSQWKDRVERLFAEYPEIPVAEMGLPVSWSEHSIWKTSELEV